MDKSNKKVLIIAMILATITSILIFTYIRKVESTNQTVQKVTIFVASKTIDARSVIINQDLKEIKIEENLINKDAIRDKNQIINMTTKEAIYEGEQILKSRLSNSNNSTLAFEIPSGKRAVTINVSEASAIGYFVNPGDYVDIIVTLEKETQDSLVPTTTKTLLQNILVLGVGQQKDVLAGVQGKTEKKSIGNNSDDQETIKTVTIAVLPEDVQKIAISEKVGSIILSLRPVSDENIIYSDGITRDNLLH